MMSDRGQRQRRDVPVLFKRRAIPVARLWNGLKSGQCLSLLWFWFDIGVLMSEVIRSGNRHLGVGNPDRSFADIRDQQWQRVGMAFLRVRPVLVAAALGILTPMLWWAPTPSGQRMRLMIGFAVMLSFFVWEAWDVRKRPLSARRLFVSLMLTLIGISVAAFNSGGLESVVVPLLLAPVVVGFAAFGRSAFSVLLAAIAMSSAVLMWGVPVEWLMPVLPEPIINLSRVVVVGLSLALSFVGVSGLVEAHNRTAQLVDEARQETISTIKARNEDMVMMSAQLAHEIKNPLTAIKGLVQLSQRDASDKAARRFDVMATELDRLEVLTQDYLKLSSPVDLSQSPLVELDALLREVVELLRPQFDAVVWRLELGAEDVWVRGHSAKLRQVFLNLLINAAQAAQAVGGNAQVMVWTIPDGESITVHVVDTGPGLSEEVRQKWGRPFFSTKAHGSGLGVMVAQTLLEQHGGVLEVYDGVSLVSDMSGAHLNVILPRERV